jgi:hypothetical protein
MAQVWCDRFDPDPWRQVGTAARPKIGPGLPHVLPFFSFFKSIFTLQIIEFCQLIRCDVRDHTEI